MGLKDWWDHSKNAPRNPRTCRHDQSFQWIAVGGILIATWLIRAKKARISPMVEPGKQQPQLVPTDIQSFTVRGLYRIPSVVAARFIYLRLAPGPRLSLWKSILSVTIAAAWPLLLNGILSYVWPTASVHSTRSWATLGIASAANEVMLSAAWITWSLNVSASRDVDAMIGFSPERPQLARWAESCLQARWQLPFLIAGGLIAAWLTYSAHRFAEIRVVSYVGEIWFTMIGVSVVYWLIVMAEFIHKLSTCTRLELYWHDPARTPALVRFCYAYIFVGAALLIGIIACEGFALFVPIKNGSLVLNGLAVAFPIFAVLIAFYVVVRPYLIVYMIVWRAKMKLLDRVSAMIQEKSLDNSDAEQLEALVNMHQGFRDMSSLPISAANIAQYVAALVATLLAYLLQHYFG